MPFPCLYTIPLSVAVLMIGTAANLASAPMAASGLLLLILTAVMYRQFDQRRSARLASAALRAEREFAAIFSVFHEARYPRARVKTGDLQLLVMPGLMHRLEGTYTFVLDRNGNHVSGLITDPQSPAAAKPSIQTVLTEIYLDLLQEHLGEKGLNAFLKEAEIRRYIPVEPPTNHARVRVKDKVEQLLAAAHTEYPWLQT